MVRRILKRQSCERVGWVGVYFAERTYPTKPFSIFELQNPSPDVTQLQKIRGFPDLEALNLRKGSSGTHSYQFWDPLGRRQINRENFTFSLFFLLLSINPSSQKSQHMTQLLISFSGKRKRRERGRAGGGSRKLFSRKKGGGKEGENFPVPNLSDSSRFPSFFACWERSRYLDGRWARTRVRPFSQPTDKTVHYFGASKSSTDGFCVVQKRRWVDFQAPESAEWSVGHQVVPFRMDLSDFWLFALSLSVRAFASEKQKKKENRAFVVSE